MNRIRVPTNGHSYKCIPLSPHDAMYGSDSMLGERRRYFPDNRNQLHPGCFFQGAGESRGVQMTAGPHLAMGAEEHKAHLISFSCASAARNVVQQEMTSQGHLIGEMQSQSGYLTGFSNSLYRAARHGLSLSTALLHLVSLTWLLCLN